MDGLNIQLDSISMTAVLVSLLTLIGSLTGSYLIYRSKMAEIHHEMRPNSGKSIKDRSDQTVVLLEALNNKIDLNEIRNEGRFDTLTAKVDGQGERMGRIEGSHDTLAKALISQGERIHEVTYNRRATDHHQE